MLGLVWVPGGTHEATFLSVSRGWLDSALEPWEPGGRHCCCVLCVTCCSRICLRLLL